MMMYNNNFCFDEIEATGNKIRIVNKMKAKNLMTLAVNFIDDKTLAKIQQVFLSLTPAQMESFKDYLDGRCYLKKGLMNSPEQKIISQVTRIALSAVPEDKYLQKLFNEYKQNLEIIDELKIKTTQTYDGDKLTTLISEIDSYNERNIELIEKVNKYRENKYSTEKQSN